MLIRYLKFQEKYLYGGVAFIIKILIKTVSNVSYLFIPGMKLLTKYELLQLLLLKFEMNVSSWERVTYNKGQLT